VPCTVTIETTDRESGESTRDVFELTPTPAPGEERRVLVELVLGIHPGAVEVGADAGAVLLRDGRRAIRASLGPGAPDDPPAGEQGTLFG
jgi:hypothetical protein